MVVLFSLEDLELLVLLLAISHRLHPEMDQRWNLSEYIRSRGANEFVALVRIDAVRREGSTSSLYSSPKCRTEFDQKETPKRYHCYCHKEIDPQFDPWLIPHSCGQTCGKRIVPECGHICLLLCHPGPCPPCPKQINIRCYCNQSGPTARRCGFKGWSCGKKCSKLLSCQQHRCEQVRRSMVKS